MPRRGHDSTPDSSISPKRGRYNLRNTRYRRNLRLGRENEGRVCILSDEEFRDKHKVLKAQSRPGDALSVKDIDLNYHLNRMEHYTIDYEQKDLILRRGQPFVLAISFDRKVKPRHDTIVLQFSYGDRPSESKGTVIRIPLDFSSDIETNDVRHEWRLRVVSVSDNCIKCSVRSPPDARVGRYKLFVETNLKGSDEEANRYEYDGVDKDRRDPDSYIKDKDGEIILIFNPFCPEDVVYMEDRAKRKEYVMNESGYIWVGNYKRYGKQAWDFGQFSKPTLDTALFLLDKGELADSGRGSAVSVIRMISALANSCDENEGVLEGRWTDEYPKGCTKPWEWVGSVAIFKKFMETRCSVQYGQCWVFSGITTSLLRSLGIPTRSVTNFESAHDTDCSNTIDFHFDEEGDPLSDLNDSKWNFHVWNESWLRRVDLPSEYDGWQAHDATPQESSEGVMRCGPASLHAIKEGHLYLNYDVNFIFAEVNGDCVYWKVKRRGEMEVMYVNPYKVGRLISTKAVGTGLRDDITHNYKYPEGSAKEREVVKAASKYGSRKDMSIYQENKEPEVEFDVDTPDSVMIGDDFEVKVKVKNLTNEERNLRIRLTLANAYYTGVCGLTIKKESHEYTLGPEDETWITMNVTAAEYEERRNPEGRFELFMSARNLRTDRMHCDKEVFSLAKPDLIIEAPSVAGYDQDTDITIFFKNTTKLTLTNGVVTVEGSGLCLSKEIQTQKTIKPGEEVPIVTCIHPTRLYHRRRKLVAKFCCDQIVNMEAVKRIKIEKFRDNDDNCSSDEEEAMDWE